MKALKEEGLAGIKDATFNIMQYAVYVRELLDEEFDVALGTEAIWVSAHALGCEAYIPGIGNVFPELCPTDVEPFYERWGVRERLKLQSLINKLRDVMYLARDLHSLLFMQLQISEALFPHTQELPFIPASKVEKDAIRESLAKLEVL